MVTIPTYALVTPLLYWLRTRLPNPTLKLHYLLTTLMPQAIGLWLMAPLSSEAFLLFTLYFIGMAAVYEIGYFDNDYLAQQRERKAGLYVRKSDPMPVRGWVWFAAISLRLMVALAVFLAAKLLGGNSWIFIGWLIAVMAIFSLHNLVLGPKRLLTFLGIHFSRIQLPVVVWLSIGAHESTQGAVTAWLVFSTIYAGTNAYFYSVKKMFHKRELWEQLIDGVTFSMVVVVFFQTMIIILLMLGGIRDVAYSLAILTAYSLAYVIVWGSARFTVEVIKAFQRRRRELTHTHTHFSHDASITMQDYKDLLDRWVDSTIYLTDHAEDFSTERYSELKKEFAALKPRIVPGLEYTVYEQHVLTHGLVSYVDIEGVDVVRALARLEAKSNRLIWAHPRIAVRRLVDKAYRRGILNLAAGVSGVELYNFKNRSRWRLVVEMAVISWLCCLLFGRRSLFIGDDCHRSEDLLQVGAVKRRDGNYALKETDDLST